MLVLDSGCLGHFRLSQHPVCTLSLRFSVLNASVRSLQTTPEKLQVPLVGWLLLYCPMFFFHVFHNLRVGSTLLPQNQVGQVVMVGRAILSKSARLCTNSGPCIFVPTDSSQLQPLLLYRQYVPPLGVRSKCVSLNLRVRPKFYLC